MWRKVYTLALGFIAAVMLASCAAEGSAFNISPSPAYTPFQGTMSGYNLRMPPGRGRDWEEDIVQFGTAFLITHPSLSNTFRRVHNFNEYLCVYHMPIDEYFFDNELRLLFIERTEDLITRAPWIMDYEIFFGLAELAALLGDAHTRMIISDGYVFPFNFRQFSNSVFCIAALNGHGNVLFAELTAINGYSIGELTQMLAPLIPFESEYYLNTMVVNYILFVDALRHVGVMDGEQMAEFTFVGGDGEIFTIEVAAVEMNEAQVIFENGDYAKHDIDIENNLMYSRPDEFYWFEYLPEESLMYVRYRRCEGIEGYPFETFINDVFIAVMEKGRMDKLVFDLRDNPGGRILSGLDTLIQMLGDSEGIIDEIYVLINTGTFSGGTITAALIKNHVERTILAGEPTGQPPDFFGYANPGVLRHSGISYWVSTRLARSWPGYEHDALMPDVYIPITINDFINNHDPVLEYIKSR